MNTQDIPTQPINQLTNRPTTINLGGIQKSSLIDYPGRVSCVLFLSGCNFDCPFCHNPDLATGCARCPEFEQEERLFSFLERRKHFLDGVVISGGEPTLQRDLEALCRRIKQMGYAVKLDTNGSRPQVLKRLLDRNLVDYIAMDVKTDPLRYAPILCSEKDPTAVLASIDLIMAEAPDYEFRTTCVRPLVDEKVVERIAQLIDGARLYVLQHLEEDCAILHPDYFRQSHPGFDAEALQSLQRIAAPHVQRCILR